MKIPKKIQVGGKQIKIKLVHPNQIDSGGDFDEYWHLIRLRDEKDKKYPKDKMEEALLHEIHEAINELFNLKLKHQTLTTMSEVLFQVMRYNKLNFSEEEK